MPASKRPLILLALLLGTAASPPHPIAPQPATPATRAVQAEAARHLPPEDGQDFEFAQRGFIATWPEPVIRQANGQPSFDLAGNDFIEGPAPDTVNPALWRQNRVLRAEGLFRLAHGLYQVRNFDNSNVSFIETPHGWIVVDPLTVAEVAHAAFELVRKHVADKPVLAVLYTHSHSDHFAGVGGIVSAADVAAGKVQVIAPKGFVKEVVSEWMIAGNAMGRRAFYQFGYFLPRGPRGHAGMGMGTAIAAGRQDFVSPTREIATTGERLTIDGVEMVFQMTPDAEAPTEMAFYLPALKALCTAETATSTLHNVQTLRGAKVRDAKAWADYLTEAARMWGGEAEIQFSSHHWPRFGNAVIGHYLAVQRDSYKFIHDQTVRLMNRGETPNEIAAELKLPEALQAEWSARGFYGTVSHNAKAVYDRYMGWYDGVPAHLDPLPPVDEAKRMVAALGGAGKVVAAARAAHAKGDERWAVQLANYAVFADPTNQPARAVLADAYEQLGYRAESAVWRNIYLTGAHELRQGHADGVRETGPSFLTMATPLTNFLDLVAVSLVPERAGTSRLGFNLVDASSGDRFAVTVGNAVMVQEAGIALPGAPTLTAPKPVLVGILTGKVPLDAMVARGVAKVDGDAAPIRQFSGMIQLPTLDFNIVEP